MFTCKKTQEGEDESLCSAYGVKWSRITFSHWLAQQTLFTAGVFTDVLSLSITH